MKGRNFWDFLSELSPIEILIALGIICSAIVSVVSILFGGS